MLSPLIILITTHSEAWSTHISNFEHTDASFGPISGLYNDQYKGPKEAAKLSRLAADQGHGDAQRRTTPSSFVRISINTLNRETIHLNLKLSTTVDSVKRQIHIKHGIPVEHQRILYSNKTLRNNLTLYDYNIRDNSKLHLVVDQDRREGSSFLNEAARFSSLAADQSHAKAQDTQLVACLCA